MASAQTQKVDLVAEPNLFACASQDLTHCRVALYMRGKLLVLLDSLKSSSVAIRSIVALDNGEDFVDALVNLLADLANLVVDMLADFVTDFLALYLDGGIKMGLEVAVLDSILLRVFLNSVQDPVAFGIETILEHRGLTFDNAREPADSALPIIAFILANLAGLGNDQVGLALLDLIFD